MTFTPACMTADELRLWREANAVIAVTRNTSDRPCRDCPVTFATEMRAKGCCNGVPSERGRATSALSEKLLLAGYGLTPAPVGVEP